MNSSFATGIGASEKELKTVFEKPLIVGASVSADHFTLSPGKRLALRYTDVKDIKTIARSGKPGRDVLKLVDGNSLHDRTILIGLDLMFWDSFGGPIQESLNALERLHKLALKENLKLVLGEVPELSPHLQPHAGLLNKKIRELCRLNNNCKILPLNLYLKDVLKAGFIEHKGKNYPLQALLPDGLHIAEPASEYLADRILGLF